MRAVCSTHLQKFVNFVRHRLFWNDLSVKFAMRSCFNACKRSCNLLRQRKWKHVEHILPNLSSSLACCHRRFCKHC
ncbi:hypothetical protein NL676_008756 [Syzygium grande]|nr:hypothetical protein NL676_008756 [Syzygium grande]